MELGNARRNPQKDVTERHGHGWQHKVDLEEGVQLADDWFKDNVEGARL